MSRTFQREMSDFEEKHERKLAALIDIGAMEDDDIGKIVDVEIPENTYRQTEVIQTDESDIDSHYVDSSQIEVADVVDMGIENGKTLPKTKAKYVSLSVREKLERFQFGNISAGEARKIVSDYLESIHYSDYPGDIFEESWSIAEAYEKSRDRDFISEEVEKVLSMMEVMDMSKEQFTVADAGMKSMLFDLENFDYNTRLQVYKGVLERLNISENPMEIYEEFEQIYEVSLNKNLKEKEQTREVRR